MRFLVLIMCCISSICQAADISVENLIQGVNQARTTIQSGEIQTKTTIEYAAKKTEKEIAAFIQSEKMNQLKRFTPTSSIGVKEFEKDFLIPYLNQFVTWDRKHTKVEYASTVFQVLDTNTVGFPELFQYKLTLLQSPDYSLESETARHHQSGVLFHLAYDTQTQIRLDIGNSISPEYLPHAVNISDSDSYYGYRHFSLFGRSPFHVPTDAKYLEKESIEGTKCYILYFTAENKEKVKIWVDVTKDFCIRKIEYQKKLPTDHISLRIMYKDYQKFGDVWFPKIIDEIRYKTNGTVESRDITAVTSAVFNVEFPQDFFKIDNKLYRNVKDSNIQGEISPRHTLSEAETLLLQCGPQSLLHLCELLKVKANINELKKLSGFDPNRGTTMKGLRVAATYKGLDPTGVRASLVLLKRNKVPLPAIAYVNANHFLVFETVDKDGVKISDPTGKYNSYLTWDKVSEIWQGELLIFNKKKEQPTKSSLVPLAFINIPEYDFGKSLGGNKIEYTFTLKNIGQKTLKIIDVVETCACTASVLSKNEIPPGETGSISTVLTVPSDNRLVHESVLVHTDDPIQNPLTLTLKGEAYLPLTTFPERLALGTQKPLSQTLEKRVSLHIQKDVKIIGVGTDSKHMKALLKTDTEIPTVKLQLLGSLPVGKISQSLFVDYTYKGKKGIHDVYIYGEVIGDLQITPDRLFFGLIKDTSSFSKTITIASRDTQPFEITSTESSTKSVKVAVVKDKNETSYKLITTISSEVKPGEVSGEVIIHTSSSDQPTVRVPFFGIIAEAK